MKVDNNLIGVKYFLDKVDVKSQYGKLALKNLKLLDQDEINKEQKILIEMISVEKDLKNEARIILSHMKNISLILKNVLNKHSLDIVDLHEIKIQAMYTKKLSEIFSAEFFNFKSVDSIISILDPNNENNFSFRLYESYDEELNDIVKRKREIEHKYYNSDSKDKPNIMALRDKVVLEEKLRVDVVISNIVNQLSKHISNMIHNVEVITHCDLVVAKALVYDNYIYCKSVFSDKFEISECFFPLVSDNVVKYTPLNIKLNEGATLIVGANMGGKSTILKNIAFNVYLINYGFLPLASKFVMPHINNVVFMQSFEDTAHGLSRFGSEVKMLNESLDNIDDNTLFLIDEFASSTNPSEGYLFVKSLINYCSNLKTYTVLTSHYDNLNCECDTYVVAGIDKFNESEDLSLSDLMNYEIYKSNDNVIPKQALLVAKYMDVNSDYLKILEDNYNKEG